MVGFSGARAEDAVVGRESSSNAVPYGASPLNHTIGLSARSGNDIAARSTMSVFGPISARQDAAPRRLVASSGPLGSLEQIAGRWGKRRESGRAGVAQPPLGQQDGCRDHGVKAEAMPRPNATGPMSAAWKARVG